MFVPPFITTPPPISVVQTGNWVGYGWKSSTKAAVEFKIPRFPWKTPLSPSEKDNRNGLALWVGLGTNPIEQIGIYDHVTNGHVGWYSVYEFWPNPPKDAGGGAMSAGDTMLASVTRKGVNYTLHLQDKGPHNKWSVTITKAFGHVENTGAFIAEDYSYTGQYPKVTGFSPVTAKISGKPVIRYAAPWGKAKVKTPRTIQITG